MVLRMIIFTMRKRWPVVDILSPKRCPMAIEAGDLWTQGGGGRRGWDVRKAE